MQLGMGGGSITHGPADERCPGYYGPSPQEQLQKAALELGDGLRGTLAALMAPLPADSFDEPFLRARGSKYPYASQHAAASASGGGKEGCRDWSPMLPLGAKGPASNRSRMGSHRNRRSSSMDKAAAMASRGAGTAASPGGTHHGMADGMNMNSSSGANGRSPISLLTNGIGSQSQSQSHSANSGGLVQRLSNSLLALARAPSMSRAASNSGRLLLSPAAAGRLASSHVGSGVAFNNQAADQKAGKSEPMKFLIGAHASGGRSASSLGCVLRATSVHTFGFRPSNVADADVTPALATRPFAIDSGDIESGGIMIADADDSQPRVALPHDGDLCDSAMISLSNISAQPPRSPLRVGDLLIDGTAIATAASSATGGRCTHPAVEIGTPPAVDVGTPPSPSTAIDSPHAPPCPLSVEAAPAFASPPTAPAALAPATSLPLPAPLPSPLTGRLQRPPNICTQPPAADTTTAAAAAAAVSSALPSPMGPGCKLQAAAASSGGASSAVAAGSGVMVYDASAVGGVCGSFNGRTGSCSYNDELEDWFTNPSASGVDAGGSAMMILTPLPLEVVERLLASAEGAWQFDAWELAEATAGHALSTLAFYLMHRSDMIRTFKMNATRLAMFLRTIESGYCSNPYHNATHAADVLQSMHVLLHQGGLVGGYADPLTLLGCYLAATMHDYEHPGLTNDFLVATNHSLALTYNDKAPLENHHAAAGLRLLYEPDTAFLPHMARPQMAALRKLVVELVLATEMKQHFAIVGNFAALHAPPPPPPAPVAGDGTTTLSGAFAQPATLHNGPSSCRSTTQDPASARSGSHAPHQHPGLPGSSGKRHSAVHAAAQSLPFPARASDSTAGGAAAAAAAPLHLQPKGEPERLVALQMVIKAADLGHTGASLPVHIRWLESLEEEFFLQGDQEAAAGLPISPLFDRSKQGASKSQVGFYEFVVNPVYQHLAAAFPGMSPMQKHVMDNYHHWKAAAATVAAAAAAAVATAVVEAAASGSGSRIESGNKASGGVPMPAAMQRQPSLMAIMAASASAPGHKTSASAATNTVAAVDAAAGKLARAGGGATGGGIHGGDTGAGAGARGGGGGMHFMTTPVNALASPSAVRDGGRLMMVLTDVEAQDL